MSYLRSPFTKILSYLLAASAGAVITYLSTQEMPTIERTMTHKIFQRGRYFSPESLDNAYEASIQVKAIQTLEEKCQDDYTKVSSGSGVLLMDMQTYEFYVLSAEHIIPKKYASCEQENKKIKIVESKILAEEIPATVVKADEQADLSLFKLEGYVFKNPFSGKVAKALEKSSYVLGIGFPQGIKKYSITSVEFMEEDITILDLYIVGGNSGGGIFLVKDEALELIGVAESNEGGITSLQKTREFLKSTPLEDDYL